MTQSTPSQIWQGLTAPVRGLRVIGERPALWGLAVLPIVLTLVFLCLAVFGAVASAGPITHWLLPGLGDGWMFLIARALVVGLLALLFGAGSYMLAALCSIPINDRMSEAVEAAMGDLPAPLSLRESLPRSIRHSIAGFLLWVLCEIVLLPLQLVPGVGSLLGAVLGFGVTAWFLAHQLLDGPMSRRAMGFSEKMGFLRGHLPWILGLGASGTLVMMVPVLNLLGLPVLVAGGAVLWVELERDRSV
ncbi:MAG: EI24 domain-containing protein [Alphaproteobacteria bacterium]|nr:EI24 domain-containing protein [Alphaproteobacteria bacterium]MCB9693218.1 EI24 domain-containing protein [Alphaproteobacteria bacterium]